MKLVDLLCLKTGSVISVAGAGGKTSLIFALARELSSKYKVLVTTTTKIYVPEKEQYDFIAVEEEMALMDKYCLSKEKGVYVFGSLVKEERKLAVLQYKVLPDICKYFDYVLIESDGSKRKSLKGWNSGEPVISINTDVTIGVLDIQVLGKLINEDLIHRLDKFMELTGACGNEAVELSHLEAVVFSDDGLFKNALGEKILFVNKVEKEEDVKLANELANRLVCRNKGKINKIITGSLKNNCYSLEL